MEGHIESCCHGQWACWCARVRCCFSSRAKKKLPMIQEVRENKKLGTTLSNPEMRLSSERLEPTSTAPIEQQSMHMLAVHMLASSRLLRRSQPHQERIIGDSGCHISINFHRYADDTQLYSFTEPDQTDQLRKRHLHPKDIKTWTKCPIVELRLKY